MGNRYQEYRDLHQCSLQEALRVLGLEDRVKQLNALRSRLGEVYSAEVVAACVVELLDVLIADADKEMRR